MGANTMTTGVSGKHAIYYSPPVREPKEEPRARRKLRARARRIAKAFMPEWDDLLRRSKLTDQIVKAMRWAQTQ